MKVSVQIEIVDPNQPEELEQLWKQILMEKLCSGGA